MGRIFDAFDASTGDTVDLDTIFFSSRQADCACLVFPRLAAASSGQAGHGQQQRCWRARACWRIVEEAHASALASCLVALLMGQCQRG
jgi:hypothetical protein